ncbi:WD40 repeat-like protein [Xylariaceae sp. FL0594]|nr:WD40 repeat-like protein [Xylariaceae sp. FL0594]
MEPGRPSSNQATISVRFDEPDSQSMIKFEVADCIETKTVTTTTTTKRSFPPLRVRHARPLASLCEKDYPLARKPTPPELTHFTFVAEDSLPLAADVEVSTHQQSSRQLIDNGSVQPASGSATAVSIDATPSRRRPLLSPRVSSSQNRRQSRSASPIANTYTTRNKARLAHQHASTSFSSNVSDRLRHIGSRTSHDSDTTAVRSPASTFPATPDTAELPPNLANRSFKPRRTHLESFETPQSESSQQLSFFENPSSPSDGESHTVYSTVATPPVTDADIGPEPFADVDADESLQQSIRALHHPRPINTIVAQDASLPSPGLSPTLQATRLSATGDDDVRPIGEGVSGVLGNGSRNAADGGDDPSVAPADVGSTALTRFGSGTYMDSQSMLESFDAMPAEMKSFMIYQFLRRCSRKTLNLVANVVNPALRCDVMLYLPVELTLHILSFLDHRDLCRAAQVSKQWRRIIDSNETGWKELLDRDGYVLSDTELKRAIKEGWGWQDPVGFEGAEVDLSVRSRLASTSRAADKPELAIQKLRSSKRKRATALHHDRSKRRASNQEKAKEERAQARGTFHRSEGPISAANAAALAVPDPQIGLPSLRVLHLFKSIYRRHYMFRKNWTSGKVKPSHVAFAAHPRHVITCLQFDEDKIITGSDDMLIHVYDTKTGKFRRRLEGHEGGVWALQYEGNVLVSGSTDRTVRVWDIENGVCTQVFHGHTSTVRCLQIVMPVKTERRRYGEDVMVPPHPLIITGSRDNTVRVWRMPDASSRRYTENHAPANDADCPFYVRTLQGHSHSVRALSAHADTLVSGSYDNTVRVWRISTGEVMHVLQGHTQKVYSVVLDVERNRCISGSMDSFIKIWDLDTGACIHTLEGHSLLVGLLDLQDQRLVSAAADSTLRIWDPESGRCQSTLTAHTGAITCFQHDGRKVVSGSDRTLKLWDTRTGECLEDLLTDLSGVWQVRFDERRCVAAVQRERLTYVEILDFGAVRDGKKPEELGKRVLLNAAEVQRMIEEDE